MSPLAFVVSPSALSHSTEEVDWDHILEDKEYNFHLTSKPISTEKVYVLHDTVSQSM